MVRLKRLQQRPLDAPVGARQGFGTCLFADSVRWKNDALLPQSFQRLTREHHPLVGLHGKISKAVHQRAKIPKSKCGQREIGAQFLKTFTPRLVADAILRRRRFVLGGRPTELPGPAPACPRPVHSPDSATGTIGR